MSKKTDDVKKPKAETPAATSPTDAKPKRLTPARIQSSQEPEGDKPAKEKATGEVDYLRKYEFHRPSGRPYWQVAPSVRYTAPDGKALIMKESLLVQPRIRMLIQRAQGEKGADVVPFTVNLNGYRLDFPKGGYIDVPEQIADLMMRQQVKTDAAVLDNPFNIENLDKPGKERALNLG